MNLGYAILLLLHILLFVYWLGADLGVFYSAWLLVDPKLTIETRQTVMKIVHFIDLFPRMALVLTLPVGITLALAGGYASLPPDWARPVLSFIWVASLAWLTLVIKLYNGVFPRLLGLDYWIRYAAIAALTVFGVASLLGHGPVAPGATWLAAKVLIFAAIVALGLGIRSAFRPFATAFGRLAAHGSTPEVEAAMRRAHARVRPVVLSLWGALIVEAFLGLSKV
ncbi:MAG TPA: hypothetical protein VKZ79_08290 [Alphaproteobacteria bacterium]|nr:hypothetical protein [Alphaproteobacteria bacterium]